MFSIFDRMTIDILLAGHKAPSIVKFRRAGEAMQFLVRYKTLATIRIFAYNVVPVQIIHPRAFDWENPIVSETRCIWLLFRRILII